MEQYKGTYFPHEERESIIAKDKRPFWREYFPNCFDIDRKAFFFESPAEIEKYLSDRQDRPIYIFFEKDEAYEPECFVNSWYTEFDEEGNIIPYGHDEQGHLLDHCSCPCVMGYGQNIPEKWFAEYTRERCIKLQEQADRARLKGKEQK